MNLEIIFWIVALIIIVFGETIEERIRGKK